MKTSELIALGLAAVAVFMIVKKTGAGQAGKQPADFVTEVFNTAGKAFENGWRYFSDGTSISPTGSYYSGGQLVYDGHNAVVQGSW